MLQSILSLALGAASLYAQTPTDAGFEGALDAARDRLDAIEAPVLVRALDAAGCTPMGSFDLGEGVMTSGDAVTLRAQSMGAMVFARCGGDRGGVSLVRTARVEKVLDGEVEAVLSSEAPRLDTSTSAVTIERRGRNETGPAPYAMAWRDESGRQYVVTAFDQRDLPEARRRLEPLITALSRALNAAAAQ
ncbi:MAG: hypothetical protein ACLFQ5_03735 [Oceanicaulis sp.]